jgi:hypothetical protein
VSCAVSFFTLSKRPDWLTCATCKQPYGGKFKMGIAKAFLETVKSLPIHNESRLKATTALIICLVEEGEPEKALMILKMLEGQMAQGIKSADVTDVLLLKAASLHELGNLKAQTEILRLIVNLKRSPDTPVMMDANNQLAQALVADPNGNWEMAEKHSRMAIEASMKGNDLGKQLSYKNTLAIVMNRLGRYDDALLLLREMSLSAKRVLGPEHQMTQVVLNTTAATLLRAKQGVASYDEAEKMVRSVYELRLNDLGSDHDETVESRRVLVAALHALDAKCGNPDCDSLVKCKLACPYCKDIRYCADKCLSDHWRAHKPLCKIFRPTKKK